MKQKPFTNKPQEKATKMIEAASHILSAMHALEDAQGCAEHWAEYETLGYFKTQLAEFMSCDEGEAGFEPYMKSISNRTFVGKPNPMKAAEKLAKQYKHFNRKGQAVIVTIPES